MKKSKMVIGKTKQKTKSQNKVKTKKSNKSRKKNVIKTKYSINNNVNKVKEIKNDLETQKIESNAKKTTKKSKVLHIVKSKFKTVLDKIKRIISNINGNKKKKKVILISILSVLIIAVILPIIIFKREPIIFTFKSFNAGEKVTFSGTEWYVIKDTGIDEKEVELISKLPFDLNRDGKIDESDTVEFDTENSVEYTTVDKNNIGYYINNAVLNMIEEKSGVKEIRLLTSDEYITLRDQMEFGYDWNEGNWLASENTKTWWLRTSKYSHIYVVTERGSYMLDEATNKNYVRPVIKVLKNYVK